MNRRAPLPTETLLKTSDYDRFASLLVSFLIFSSIAVAILFSLWFSTQLFSKKSAVSVQLEQLGDGGSVQDDRLDANVTSPGYEVEFDEPTFSEAVDQVADVISNQSSLFTNPSLKTDVSLSAGLAKGTGSGAASQGVGKPGRTRRWEVQFHDQRSIRAYAQQLDFFNIELAVLRPGGYVIYFSQLSKPRPIMRQDLAANEKRYYLTWLKPELQEADRQLIAKTGTTLEPKQIILKFLSPETEQLLTQLERDAAGKQIDHLRVTYFGVRRVEQDYEFYVIRQTFDGR